MAQTIQSSVVFILQKHHKQGIATGLGIGTCQHVLSYLEFTPLTKGNDPMTRTVTRIAVIITLTALTACATISGMGKDLSNAGKAISKSAS
jgi:predicted small secreted protein